MAFCQVPSWPKSYLRRLGRSCRHLVTFTRCPSPGQSIDARSRASLIHLARTVQDTLGLTVDTMRYVYVVSTMLMGILYFPRRLCRRRRLPLVVKVGDWVMVNKTAMAKFKRIDSNSRWPACWKHAGPARR